jgi:hypothetical protein
MPRRFPDDEGFDKVNFIIDSWSTDCDAPWYIYIETMKPAAIEAFLVLLSFGWADVLRGALRPKGLGRRTSKRKGRWNRRIPRFPEIGNTIGKALPFAEQLDDFVTWKTPTKFLWRIDNLMQAGLFWWLVADVAEDFVFNWTSLLYESYWCQPDPPGKFSYQTQQLQVFPGGYEWRINFELEDYEHAPPGWGYVRGYTGDNPAQVTVAAAFERHPVGTPATWFQIKVIYDDGSGTIFASGEEPVNADGNLRMPVTGTVPANTVFQVRASCNGSWGMLRTGVVLGVESKPA